ncbi:hypothetical protein C8R46DRAFT_1212806 [Mycena filopes]|nr:hypothetical protein C8R46DRAFT_1212806 [Mycena filopes]
MTRRLPLPGFQFVTHEDFFWDLHECLWGTEEEAAAALAAPLDEPPALARCISTCPVEDAAPMRYIDLDLHPVLRVHTLLYSDDLPKMLVRAEYVEFMRHILSVEASVDRRFFLTGQPGIGKSVCALYIVFWLLSRRQPLFLVLQADQEAYYFSEDGVQTGTPNGDNKVFHTAVAESWVVIDVDIGDSAWAANWYPGRWVNPCAALIWTSAPWYNRRRRFTDRYRARLWYMSPWTFAEIEFVTEMLQTDPADVRARFQRSGPVARPLFYANTIASATSMDQVVRRALSRGLFDLPITTDSEDETFDLFPVRPREELDRNTGISKLIRDEATFSFLSDHILEPFDDPLMRPAARQLLEKILHKALFRAARMSVPQWNSPLRVGDPDLRVSLLDQAHNFTIESSSYFLQHPPQSDSILVTDAAIWLIPSPNASYQSDVFNTFLGFLRRLGATTTVSKARRVYCVVGTDGERVRRLVREGNEKVIAMRSRSGEPGQRLFFDLEVEGFVSNFDGLTAVAISEEVDNQ